MTIEIDDSGTGEMVGNAFIGLRKVEPNHMIFKRIPLETFGKEEWLERKPQFMVIDLVKEEFKELHYSVGEEINLCTSPFFDKLREYFRRNDIPFKPSVIEDPLNQKVEIEYLRHLKKIGVDFKSAYTLDPKKRTRVLRDWVLADYDNRLRFVKVGYKKGFRKLKLRHQEITGIIDEDLLLDPVSTIYNFCNINGYFRPQKYYTQLSNDIFKLGVSIRPIYFEFSDNSFKFFFKGSNYYSDTFEEELNCVRAITAESSGLGKKITKHKVFAEICDKLGLKFHINQ